MAAAGGKKKFKFDFEIDILGNKPAEVKADFQKESREFIEGDPNLKKIVQPQKFKVEAELDEHEWNEKKIISDGYYAFRMQVKGFDACVKKAKAKNKPESIQKDYKNLCGFAQKGFEKWLKDTESGKGNNDKALKDGAKALSGMQNIDPGSISQKPRTDAVKALAPLLKPGAGEDDKAKEKAKAELEAAHDDFKKNGGEANSAIKALLDTAKKIAGNAKADAALKAFGAAVTKEKGFFKAMSTQLDVLSKALEEAAGAAGEGKLDDKAAKSYTEMLKKMKSLDGSVAKGFAALDKHAKAFDKIKDKLK